MNTTFSQHRRRCVQQQNKTQHTKSSTLSFTVTIVHTSVCVCVCVCEVRSPRVLQLLESRPTVAVEALLDGLGQAEAAAGRSAGKLWTDGCQTFNHLDRTEPADWPAGQEVQGFSSGAASCQLFCSVWGLLSVESTLGGGFNQGLTGGGLWFMVELNAGRRCSSVFSSFCAPQERAAAGRAGEAAPGDDRAQSEGSLFFNGRPVCPARSRAPANEEQVCA